MVDYLLNLLIEYKYWIVIGGALIEGEIVLLIAGMAAFHGYLSINWVIIISFLGAIFHDHMLFFVGKGMGAKLFKKFPKVRRKSDKVFRLFHKYQNVFILGFRFVYGIRTITPIIIGSTQISAKRYSLLTIIAGVVWAVVVSLLGYGFAAIISEVIESFQRYQKYLAMGLGVGVVIWWGIYQVRKSRKKKALKLLEQAGEVLEGNAHKKPQNSEACKTPTEKKGGDDEPHKKVHNSKSTTKN